jgi:hypothetical protein
MRYLTFIILLLIFCNAAVAQQPSHKLVFRYRIRQDKLDALAKNNVFLKDNKGTRLALCKNSILKAVITNTSGLLTVDAWTIKDKRITEGTGKNDPCYEQSGILNAATAYPLNIDIRRGQQPPGPNVKVGHSTKVIHLHYQTWVIGVNTIGAKFRPRVKDYNGNEYSTNVISGSINAGFTLGYSFGWTTFTHRNTTSWSLTPAFALGFSAASLGKEPLKKQVSVTYNPSNFVLSPSIGCIIARNDLGILFNYGHDFMFGKNSSAWAYQKKKFFGIGLSASFKL